MRLLLCCTGTPALSRSSRPPYVGCCAPLTYCTASRMRRRLALVARHAMRWPHLLSQTVAALPIGPLNTFSPDLVLGARKILPAERANILASGWLVSKSTGVREDLTRKRSDHSATIQTASWYERAVLVHFPRHVIQPSCHIGGSGHSKNYARRR